MAIHTITAVVDAFWLESHNGSDSTRISLMCSGSRWKRKISSSNALVIASSEIGEVAKPSLSRYVNSNAEFWQEISLVSVNSDQHAPA
jgi:hypothetical protein